MSAESPAIVPVLSIHERRVLGVLVEKQKTTDTYPLSLNALVTGSNQKSNRDPLLDLEDIEVEEALTSCQKQGLVMRVISGRVDKWKHLLYDAWKVNSVELAVLAELLLRGPQTEGELRARASRMEEIADVDALRQVLIPLRDRRLVVYLTPEGRRGTVVTHGFHDEHELNRLRAYHSSQPIHADLPSSMSAPHPSPAPADAGQIQRLEDQVNQLTNTVQELRDQLNKLKVLTETIQKELGMVGE